MGGSVPSEIVTGGPELDRVRSRYAPGILGRPGILIPDTDDDLALPRDFRPPLAQGPTGVATTLEEALRQRVEAAFYAVGPALSAYMICDWQLWLWNAA